MDHISFVKHRQVTLTHYVLKFHIKILYFVYCMYQAVVFTNLYKGWKEYNIFVIGLTEGEVKRALESLKKEIINTQKQRR